MILFDRLSRGVAFAQAVKMHSAYAVGVFRYQMARRIRR